MTNDPSALSILLVEDDEESLRLLSESLPESIEDYQIEWEFCADFDEAIRLVSGRRFDVVVTDIYRDRTDHEKGDSVDEKAGEIVSAIRNIRFCPIVVFTDGSAPQTIQLGPFIKLADKSGGNKEILSKLRELLATGIPSIARKLHDELDQSSGSYLWEFLESRWHDLESTGASKPAILERLIRRRAAMRLGRLVPGVASPAELESVHGLEYYVYPPVSDDLRLGEIIKHNKDETIRVVLTPHCHLTVQSGDTCPRADHVLTLKTFPAPETIVTATAPETAWKGSSKEKTSTLRRRTKLVDTEKLGRPTGRYCFLPGFLDIPDLYYDLLQAESLPFKTITDDYERLAVLDTPFAEALQSCFARFYSRVGLPELDTEGVQHLIE